MLKVGFNDKILVFVINQSEKQNLNELIYRRLTSIGNEGIRAWCNGWNSRRGNTLNIRSGNTRSE